MNELEEVEQIQSESHPVRKILIKYGCFVGSIIAGGLSMGVLTGLINLKHGTDVAVHSGINQAIYSGFSTGVLTRVYEILVNRKIQTPFGGLVPIVVPAIVTTYLCYLTHKFGIPYLRDPSPNPELSTAPTAVIIILIMPVYDMVYKRFGKTKKL